MEKDTVSMHFVAAAVARLSAEARLRVLRSAGIAPTSLDSTAARVPAQAFATLWLAVAGELDDEFFGLDRRRMKVGSFALLCHALLPSASLESALRQMLRGFAVLLDDVRASLRIEGGAAAPEESTGVAIITLHNRIADVDARRFADETLLVMIHGLMCWLAGRRIRLRAVQFAGPRPAHAIEYPTMFSPHLAFDAEVTSVRFDARVLTAAPVQDLASLKTFLRRAPQSVFLAYRNRSGWSARVRREMRRSVGEPSWPGLEELARLFDLGPTTLRRRLEAEGSSVQEIRDKLRCDIAMQQLGGTALDIAHIGQLLGFAEPRAFYRAFKRWSGMRPGEYRRARLAIAAPGGASMPRPCEASRNRGSDD